MTDRITEAKKVFERWARENDMCLEPGNGRMYANEQTERAFLLRCKPDQKELRNASAVLRAHQFLRNLGVVDDAACDVTELVKLMQTGRNADRYLLLRNNVGKANCSASCRRWPCHSQRVKNPTRHLGWMMRVTTV